MGGPINYGYSVAHTPAAKVVINEDEAPILLHIFEEYASGKRIPDIVRDLGDKGITNRGKPFTVNSIYFMLQQEKYTGVYNFNGETFTNVYPAIIPKELYQIVRKRIDANKTGKHVVGVEYILISKCFCGYCGHKLRSAAGTTTDGTILRYYRCPHSKKDQNCHNKSIRKEVLEEIITNTITEEVARPENLALLTDKVFEMYCVKASDDSDLHRYEKELAATDRAIKNILTAIEEGVFTPSTKQRLTELEEKKARLEQAIIVENTREKSMITEEDIERYITDAIKLSAKQMVDLLVERIDVYADKLCIKLKYSDTPIEPPASFSDTSAKAELKDFSDTVPTENPKDFSHTDFSATAQPNHLKDFSDAVPTENPKDFSHTDFSVTAQTNHLKDFSDTAPNNLKSLSGTADNNAEPLRHALQAVQTDTPPAITNTNNNRPDSNNSCRGGLLFRFTKRHEITQTRIYKSGRTRVFISTTTFMIELYI